MHSLIKVTFGLFTLIGATSAFGWGDIGHGAVGEIAERNLTPQGKKFVHEIIGTRTLASGATYPDSVRSDARYADFSPFHFFEIPEGYTFQTLPQSIRAERDADTIIQQAPKLLKGFKLSRPQKAVLLDYLVHIVGDVHMPGHIGNGVDRGANLCDVKMLNRASNQIEKTNLHKAWDDYMVEEVRHQFNTEKPGKWFGYKEMADLSTAAQTQPQTPAQAYGAGPGQWYQDSINLRPQFYPDVTPATALTRKYCKQVDPQTKQVINGAYDASQIPTLDQAYINRSLPIVKTQIYLAGLRLAAMINKMAQESGTFAAKSDIDTKFLKNLLLKNKKKDASGDAN